MLTCYTSVDITHINKSSVTQYLVTVVFSRLKEYKWSRAENSNISQWGVPGGGPGFELLWDFIFCSWCPSLKQGPSLKNFKNYTFQLYKGSPHPHYSSATDLFQAALWVDWEGGGCRRGWLFRAEGAASTHLAVSPEACQRVPGASGMG